MSTDHSNQYKVYEFFKALKNEKVITRVKADLADDIIEHLPDKYRGAWREKDSYGRFDRTQRTAPESFCTLLIDILRRIQYPRNTHLVPGIYNRIFEPDTFETEDSDPSRTLFAKHDHKVPDETCEIMGDYVLFRTEQRGPIGSRPREIKVSRMFLRAFTHKSGYARIMLVPPVYQSDSKETYLGARGWLLDNDDDWMSVCHIIDRTEPDFIQDQIYGGVMVLSIRSRSPRYLTVRDKCKLGHDRLFAGPAHHFRALHGQQVSASRAYLVRATGLEDLGGAASETRGERYEAIRRLQKSITNEFSEDLNLSDASKLLSKLTGFPQEVFYNTGDSKTEVLANPTQGIWDNQLTDDALEIPPWTYGALEQPKKSKYKDDPTKVCYDLSKLSK